MIRTVLTFAALAVAVPAAAEEILPAGVVACISQKTAQQYAEYVATAPDFAADYLARATCYINNDDVQVVPTGKSGEFAQYKLLTGHKVWVAKGTTRPVNTAAVAK